MLAVALCSCATRGTDGGFEPLWAQRPDELGRLPVGRVESVEQARGGEPAALATQASAGRVAGASVSPSTAGVIASTTGTAAFPLHRYTLRMRGGGTRLVEAEQAFRVGDCVAIRAGAEGQAALVSARPEECR